MVRKCQVIDKEFQQLIIARRPCLGTTKITKKLVRPCPSPRRATSYTQKLKEADSVSVPAYQLIHFFSDCGAKRIGNVRAHD
jgi:hypothetical protein